MVIGQLSWQPGFSLSRKPVKKSRPQRKKGLVAGRPQPIIFVTENPSRSRAEFKDVTGLARADTSHSYGEDGDRSTIQPSSELTQRHASSVFVNKSLTDSKSYDASSYPLAIDIPSMQYSNLLHRFRPLLDRYNSEFCKIPLTLFVIGVNPFKYCHSLALEPACLMHAVMALAGHHVESTEIQSHRHTALHLMRKNLNAFDITKHGHLMLDTLIILFSLDETQSAVGNWRTHLIGAYSILEACGGIEVVISSIRLQAQVATFMRWDAITSLVAREDCVFPYAYFHAILPGHNAQQWDFFGLFGCPLDLVKIVMRLARLSAEKCKSQTLNASVLSDLVHSLESWQHVSPESAMQDEEEMQRDRDTMHCSEAWRHGLLLYVYRVFQWETGIAVPTRILYRARAVVDHVFACRDESMVSRQALLPLLFAGCELRDRSTRRKIVKFCAIWDARTRYHMFSTTVPLLEEIWAEQERVGFENVWWGQVVDRRHLALDEDGRYPLQLRLCFG